MTNDETNATTAPLSTERLEEIQARVDKATPGPWELELAVTHEDIAHYSIRTRDPLPPHPWSPRYIAWLTGSQPYMSRERPPIKVCDVCGMVAFRYRHLQRQVDIREDPETAADAAFIAHARTDMGDVLADNKRLRAELAAAREHLMLVLDDAEVYGWQSEWTDKARELLASAEAEIPLTPGDIALTGTSATGVFRLADSTTPPPVESAAETDEGAAESGEAVVWNSANPAQKRVTLSTVSGASASTPVGTVDAGATDSEVRDGRAY